MNSFQAQYPLSPKKFWKKEISTMIPYGILFVVLLCGISIALIAARGSEIFPLLGIISACAIILWGILMFLYAWYFKAYIRTYYYDGAENFITIRKKFFTPQEIHVLYQKIQDVYVDQDLLDRIMGLYDVHIASATVSSSIEAHIDGVDAATAEGLKNFFLDKVQHGSSGGQRSSAVPAASTSAESFAPVPEVSTPTFTGNISNVTYPFQNAWLIRRIIGIIVVSIFIGFWLSSFFSDYTHGISLLVFVLGTIVAFIANVIYILVWRKNYRFEFLPEFVLLRTGVFSLSEKHVPYASIQDVIVSQTLLDRIFGLSNVTIQNAARNISRKRNTTDIVIPGQTPASAQALAESVKEILLTKNSSKTGL
jgi:membrane protein YdbS with pleckstrin-like domain